MISFEKLLELIPLEKKLEIFKKGLSYGDLFKFWRSIRKSVILLYTGDQASDKLLESYKKYQWPFLQEMTDPQLDIYRRVDDKKEVDDFIKSIKEKNILQQVKLYPKIFDFSKKEMRECKEVAERYKKILEKTTKRVRRLKCGITTGIVGMGMITGGYLIGRQLRKKEDIKGKFVKGKIKIEKE